MKHLAHLQSEILHIPFKLPSSPENGMQNLRGHFKNPNFQMFCLKFEQVLQIFPRSVYAKPYPSKHLKLLQWQHNNTKITRARFIEK